MTKSRSTRWMWFHRACAIAWAIALIPAYLWWSESIGFVIAASVYANIKSDWGAAEAADNRELLDQLDRIEQQLRHLVEQRET